MRAKRQVITGLFNPNTLDQSRWHAHLRKNTKMRKTEANAVDFEDMIIYAATPP